MRWKTIIPVIPAVMALSAAMAPSASAQILLVGNKGENTLSFIDLASGKELDKRPTGPAPHEIAISPDGRQAAVVAYGGASVDIFDVPSRKLLKTVDIAPNKAPHGIHWLRDGRIALAADKSNSVVIVDPKTLAQKSIPTEQKGTHMLVVSPDERLAYASNILSGTVSIVDLQQGTKIGDIKVGGFPEGLALTPDGRQLWVGDDSGPRLKVVDVATRAVVDTLETDPFPIRVLISPDGKSAITSNFLSGTLSLFDVETRKLQRTISVSGEKSAMQVTMAFGADPRILYVAETGRDSIAEVKLDTGEVARRIPAGKNGDGLAIVP